MSKSKGKSRAVTVSEPEQQVAEKKKIEPPKIESSPLKIWKDENGLPHWVIDMKSGDPSLRRVAGVKDSEIAENIIWSAAKAVAPDIGLEKALNVIIQSENDYKPQDAMESRLVAQAAVAFQHGMEFIKRGANSDMLCHLEPLTNLGIKFMKVHNETIEALNKYRRGGEQKVIVTHIAEKIAVVNNFGSPGGGVSQEKEGDSPCLESAEQ